MLEIINVFISSVIMIITVLILGMIVDSKSIKYNKKILKLIILIAFYAILHTIFYICFRGSLKTIMLFTLYIIFYKHVLKFSNSRSIICSVIYAILTIIPDLIIITIFTKLFNISKEYYYLNIAGSILGNIMVNLLAIIIAFVTRKLLIKFNYSVSTSKKIVCISILAILFITYFFYKFATGYKMNENIMIYIITILGFIIILFSLFKQKIENEAILKKYDDLLNIMKNYESDIEEQRTMIHETRNELMTIKSKISDKSKETEIIKYIDSILGDKTSSNMSKYSKFMYLPSNGIKGFFYYKFNEAEKRNIKVSVNISKRIENSFLGNLETKDFKDLIRIIGVYLDNAIEASEQSKEKKLGIEIYLVKKDIEIIISNTFENEINMEKIGKEKFTTKGKNHGHGLLLVKHIINNNQIFTSKTEIINKLYVQNLKIKNKKGCNEIE